MAILSRRKKGKTALLQRFFNVLYTRNDPQLIPFYYRIPEKRQTQSDFTESFYRRVLTQYFAFIHRQPEWVGTIFTMEELKELAGSDPYLAGDVRGATNFHYQGLGDRVFAMVFRRIYGAEIDRVSVGEIDDDFKGKLAALKGQLSVHKGAAAGPAGQG